MNIIERYERELKVIKGKSENTITAYIKDIDTFRRYYMKKNSFNSFDEALEKISYAELEDYTFYLIEQGYKKSSINRSINALKSFFKYAERYIGKNVCKDISTFNNIETKKKDLITKDQVLKLLEETERKEGHQTYFDYISKRNKFIISLLATSGLRAEELLTIKKEKIVDFGDYARVIIDCHEGKTKLNKNIIICGITYNYYKEYLKEYKKKFDYNDDSYLILSGTGKKVNKKDTNKMLKKYAERIGMEESLSNHCFRMFANMALMSAGCPDTIRNKTLGWSDSNVGSNNYFHDDSIEADQMKIKYVSKILE